MHATFQDKGGVVRKVKREHVFEELQIITAILIKKTESGEIVWEKDEITRANEVPRGFPGLRFKVVVGPYEYCLEKENIISHNCILTSYKLTISEKGERISCILDYRSMRLDYLYGLVSRPYYDALFSQKQRREQRRHNLETQHQVEEERREMCALTSAHKALSRVE